MRRFRVLLVTTLVILIIASAPFHAGGQSMSFGRSSFALSVGQSLDDEGNVLLVVNMSVPYRRLVFLKRGQRYESRFRIYVNVKDGRDRQIRGEVWEESVVVVDYEETKSTASVASARRTFPVEPDKYEIEVSVEVIDTSLRYTQKKTIEILGREGGKFRVGDPAFFASRTDTSGERPSTGQIAVRPCVEPAQSGFRSNDQAIYADFNVWPRIVFNLVAPSETIENEAYTVSSRIRDRGRNVVLYNRTYLQASESGYQRLCMDVNIDDLSIGDYEISVAVELPRADRKAVSKGRFTILLNRGTLEEHFDETMEILSLYADRDELEELAESTRENRVAAWNRFWRGKDPNPSSKVNEGLGAFLHRLEYVLRNFSSFSPGWRTDRGRIYIRYGRPDDVVDRQGRAYGTNYQLWFYYSRGVVYIFEDMLGTGDYRLLETRMI
jgi:GWxTD domain-containing protein